MHVLIRILKPLFVPILRHYGFLRSDLELRAEGLKQFVSYEYTPGNPPFNDYDLERLRITFIIPDFQIGAGGHMTIFRIAHFLEKFGHTVRFLIQNPSVHQSPEDARKTINDHFQPFEGEVIFLENELPDFTGDALIATDRFTCYPARAMGGFTRTFYFVQDYEPYFYAMGPEYLLTETTYQFDFDCLCAGEWLSEMMVKRYNRWSIAWPLAYDKTVYMRRDDVERAPNRIALYARYITPRRAVELAFLALEILHTRGVSFEVDFFGWDIGKLRVDYPYKNHGVLDGTGLASLYQQATVGVVFSATNHSLVDKEMMACGLPVLDLEGENTRAIFPDDVMEFCKPTPEDIADKLQALLENGNRLDALRESGYTYVAPFSWEKSARIVEGALQERVVTFARKELQKRGEHGAF